MSYEGFTQLLCANGHLSSADCFEMVECNSSIYLCPICKYEFVWRHEVDQTNDAGELAELELDKPAITEFCNLGHTHILRAETWKIPVRK